MVHGKNIVKGNHGNLYTCQSPMSIIVIEKRAHHRSQVFAIPARMDCCPKLSYTHELPFAFCCLNESNRVQSERQGGKMYPYQRAYREVLCQTERIHLPDSVNKAGEKMIKVQRKVGQSVDHILITMSQVVQRCCSLIRGSAEQTRQPNRWPTERDSSTPCLKLYVGHFGYDHFELKSERDAEACGGLSEKAVMMLNMCSDKTPCSRQRRSNKTN